MSTWIPVPQERSRGIAIHNYQEVKEQRVQLTVGEYVHILKENSDWYFGYAKKDKSVLGIFPKSFVHIKDPSNVEVTCENSLNDSRPEIISEVATTLREWHAIYKEAYMTRNKRATMIENRIKELILLNHKMMTSLHELPEVIEKIDSGNRVLGLDMIVRDDQGDILNPYTVSVAEFYRRHVITTERISYYLRENENAPAVVPQSDNYTFFLSVRSSFCESMNDIELLFVLYDQNESKQFSDNFIIRCTQEMISDNKEVYNITALFTDLDVNDLNRESVYLVCYAIRIGAVLESNSKIDKEYDAFIAYPVRRPFAVACYNLTPYFKNYIESNDETLHFLPLMSCNKGSLDNTLKKCFIQKEYSLNNSKVQNVQAKFKLLPANLKQLQEENPYLTMNNVTVVRKIGFSEVIVPNDFRNDLFVTIVNGEFSGLSYFDRNVEVVATVCDDKCMPVQDGIIVGSGMAPQKEYHSVVHHRDAKPSWFETFKVVLPIDYKDFHLKFIFKHRSSKNRKIKEHEKPFAMSFLRLDDQQNGAVLKDDQHSLQVYKINQKHCNYFYDNYLEIAYIKHEINEDNKSTKPGLTNESDHFVIQTKLCSTKFSQNTSFNDFLKNRNFSKLTEISDEEIARFLEDVLDTLFVMDTDDDRVFEFLLRIIGLFLEGKYKYLQPGLDIYIEKHFESTFAFKILISVLKKRIDNIHEMEKDNRVKLMNALKHIMKFITKSASTFSQMHEDKTLESVEDSMNELFKTITRQMGSKPTAKLLIEAECLTHLLPTISDIATVFCPVKLSSLLLELIDNLSNAVSFTKWKLTTIDEVILSPLFLLPDCRTVLLNKMLYLVKPFLENSNELELCIKILNDVMHSVFKREFKSSRYDINEIMSIILRTLNRVIIHISEGNPLRGGLASILISIYRQMTWEHYNIYLNHFTTRSDLLEFVLEMLEVFKILLTKSPYPTEWCEMILLQNNVILNSLEFFSDTICKAFISPFEHQAWNSFFHLTAALVSHPALQLEKFSEMKRSRIFARYTDMRIIGANKIRFMWYKLGRNKTCFVPHLVRLVLEVSMIPEKNLRKSLMPLFFDMMRIQFNSVYDGVAKSNFLEFENVFYTNLHNLIEDGKCDTLYVKIFSSIMMHLCENHTALREQGTRFVSNVTRLMEKLLVHRSMINDQSKGIRIGCIAGLLDFYLEIDRKEMYVRYLDKLFQWHYHYNDNTEAGFTLKLYSNLLSWSDDPLPPYLRIAKYAHCETHRSLKELLYSDMILCFHRGEVWEFAIDVCKELVVHYEDETFDYEKLILLLNRMSQLYNYITKRDRATPTYFRVAHYGEGFPPFLKDIEFIHRGKAYEKLDDFCCRVMNEFPNATLMRELTPPNRNILESPEQFLQINCVKPIMDEKMEKLLNMANHSINKNIFSFYKVNKVSKFQFDRRTQRKDENEEENEFASLWQERTTLETSDSFPGILPWFPIISWKIDSITPLECAIEAMQESNNKLKEMVITYSNDDTIPFTIFEMHISGILRAPVNGGVSQYEKVFLTPQYLEKHPTDVDLVNTLKDLIACQIPLLDIGVQILGQRLSRLTCDDGTLSERDAAVMVEAQNVREKQFEELKISIEGKYGKKESNIKFEELGVFYTPPVCMIRKRYLE